MALPIDGPLSFSMIAGELGTSTPYSLRVMSDSAGFSTPDSVSEFYGYGPGGGLTVFFVSLPVNDPSKVCIDNPSCCTPVWHNGTGPLPSIGDIVYEDSSGIMPLTPFKDEIFYGMNEVECDPALLWFKLSSSGDGQVIDTGGCN